MGTKRNLYDLTFDELISQYKILNNISDYVDQCFKTLLEHGENSLNVLTILTDIDNYILRRIEESDNKGADE